MSPSFSRTVPLIAFALLLGVLALIASACSNAPFILDDLDQLQQSASQCSVLDALKPDCYGLYRPVKTVVFFIFSRLSPGAPYPWRIFGFILFCLSAGLVYNLAFRLFSNPWYALATASIWATAPTQVSTIAWCSSINILIMAVSSLLAMLLFDLLNSQARFTARSALYIVGIILSYLVSFFSYESAIVLPGLLLIWSISREQNIFSKSSIITMACCTGTALIMLGIRHYMAGSLSIENTSIHGFTPLQLSMTSGMLVWDHLALWFWPFGRQAITGTLINENNVTQIIRIVSAWICLGLLCLIAWLTRKKCRQLGLGLIFFLVAFFPMSNLVPLFNGPYADYYLIIPSFGLTIATVGIAKTMFDKLKTISAEKSRMLYVAILFGFFAIRLLAVGESWTWSTAWNNELTLFVNTLRTFPEAFTAKATIARNLQNRGEYALSEKLANEAIDSAPWFDQAKFVLISIYLKTDRYAEAMEQAKSLIEKGTASIFPLCVYGFLAENHINDRQLAIKSYRKTTSYSWQSGSEDAVINLARLLSLEHKDSEAKEVLEEGVLRAPGAKNIPVVLSLFEENTNIFRQDESI